MRMRAWQIRYMRLERRCDRGETQRGGGDSIVLGLTEVVSKTGFHPVWDISYQKPCFLVQILRLHRFDLVPTYKIRPAGVNFQIWQFMLSVSPIVLQENDPPPIFSSHARVNHPCDN